MLYFKWMEDQSIIKDSMFMILAILSIFSLNLVVMDKKSRE